MREGSTVDQPIDEKKFWIAQAIKKKGALRKTLGVSKKTGKIPAGKIAAAAKKKNGGVTGRRARLAKTLKSFHEDEVLHDPIGAVVDGASVADVIDALLR